MISVVLITNAFVWYYCISEFLKDIMNTLTIDQYTSILIWSAHFGGIIGSAIIGALIIKKIKSRTNFLILWMVLGTISSVTSMLVDLTNIATLFSVALFLGISLGIGMPCCMGYFTESIGTERRGRVAGIMLLLTGVFMVVFGLISGSIISQILIFSAWKIFGLMFLLIFKGTKEDALEKVVKPKSYQSLTNQRSFILYLVPWIMFSLITYLTAPIQNDSISSSYISFMLITGNALIAIFGVVGGFLLDIVGRKRMSILGFVLLGLGYAALGLDVSNMLSWYFYTIVDGIAWGILFVIFVVTIWGDLSYNRPSDMFYAIGVTPFFISKFLQLSIGSQIAADIPATSIFSLTAFFLFLAVLPLVYAPETLPEKTMKDRELKNYVDKAQKMAQKENDKRQNKEKEKPAKEESPEKKKENGKEYEEARELAEKYY
ncbi:MAG: hypothetical protein NWF01_11780 [Candidatus Bathyarchaeota archaeon]|nr:hypothetical protein [Candidatus Bathyarchaeota archaeon]